MVLNALNNAFQYTRDTIRVAARIEGDWLELRVEDNGSGYPASMLRDEATASKAQAAGIWKIRDDIEGLFQHTLPAVTFDVSLPIVAMQDYVRGIEAEASAAFGSDFKFVVFGHIGDGNLHIVLGTQPFTDQTRHRIEEIVYSPLKALGGSISAEHGIGLEKRDWLTMCRSDAEIALMRTLKTAMDPKGILNPGKVLA